MKHLLIALCVLLTACASPPRAKTDVPVKQVTLDAFMQGNVMGGINVPVLIPADFEPAELQKANFGYSYWMKPADVAAANATGDLPGQSGYMYGKISPNVGYDAQRDFFIGLEEPASLAIANTQMKEFKLGRYRYGSYAIALMSFSAGDNKGYVYAMLVATNIDTNVVYIALRPPGDSKEVGEQIWNQLKASLEKTTRRGE
jgi:hypothetical protein